MLPNRFRDVAGLPPNRNRIGTSGGASGQKGLLAGTDLPIADVSRRAGFATQAQLNHHLKRLLGLTPAAFRRQGRRQGAARARGAPQESKNPQEDSKNPEDGRRSSPDTPGRGLDRAKGD